MLQTMPPRATAAARHITDYKNSTGPGAGVQRTSCRYASPLTACRASSARSRSGRKWIPDLRGHQPLIQQPYEACLAFPL